VHYFLSLIMSGYFFPLSVLPISKQLLKNIQVIRRERWKPFKFITSELLTCVNMVVKSFRSPTSPKPNLIE
uniref:Uncharacterized protein n=1 Tax=Parascaris univalens TaxID=6257 RepID=A0A915AWH7_PARUN